ncbi:hypothetical protein ABI59_17815 [Acidobacteria bacterium Mor1]|nr:hypothetical protein ABI59_17815 [Acidobacteria bacterium Mor1]
MQRTRWTFGWLLMLVLACPAAAATYSAPVPALEGFYPTNLGGNSYKEGPVDFGDEFTVLSRAWLRVSGVVGSGQTSDIQFQVNFAGFTGELILVEDLTTFEVDLEIPVPLSFRDGTEQVGLTVIPLVCCDIPAEVTSATVWVESQLVPGALLDRMIISQTEGGFGGTLDDGDGFGSSTAWLGDLDGDGFEDLAAGAYRDDDGANAAGAVWVLFLNEDLTVRREQKISMLSGGFGGTLAEGDLMGLHMDDLGDIDGNGTHDLAVSTYYEPNGSVWILRLNPDGSVLGEQRVGPGEGGFTGEIGSQDLFTYSIAAPGDVDGDGVPDLAVGAPLSLDASSNEAGAVWILFLNADGTVKGHYKITPDEPAFAGAMPAAAQMGISVISGEDFDDDGREELVISGGIDTWILYLDTDGSVLNHERMLGSSWPWMAPGDVNGDGIPDVYAGGRFRYRNGDGTYQDGAELSRFRNGWGFAGGIARPRNIESGDGCSFLIATGGAVDTLGGSVAFSRLDGSGSVEVLVARDRVDWCTTPRATGYDLIRGDLDALRSTGGDYSVATSECLADDSLAGGVAYPDAPPPGSGYFFFARRGTRDGAGSYDGPGPGQIAPRDGGIAASGSGCP